MNDTNLINFNESANHGRMQAPVLNVDAMVSNPIYGVPPRPEGQIDPGFTNFNAMNVGSGTMNYGSMQAPTRNPYAAAPNSDYYRMTGPGVQFNPNTLGPHSVGGDFRQMPWYAGPNMGNESLSENALHPFDPLRPLHPANAFLAHMYNNRTDQATLNQAGANSTGSDGVPGSHRNPEDTKVKRACNYCRSKKYKCSGHVKCSACNRAGISCEYRIGRKDVIACERCVRYDYTCSGHRPSCIYCHRDGAFCSNQKYASPKQSRNGTSVFSAHKDDPKVEQLRCKQCALVHGTCDLARPCSTCISRGMWWECNYPGDRNIVCTRCLSRRAGCDRARPRCKTCVRDGAPHCQYRPK